MPLNGTLSGKTLYVSLDTRPLPGEYVVCPALGLTLTDSTGKPVLHHASNRNGPWFYEDKDESPEQSLSLIVLIRVDNVKSHSNAVRVVQGVPTDGSPSQRTGENFTCRVWAKDALVSLHKHGEIQLPMDIDTLEQQAVKHGLKYAPVAEHGRSATILDNGF